ncbi:hypothetical protein OKJ99_08680, partial [Streptomyces endophyticus]|nr:hypothetical protein [Streptomyces endophyticus]
MSVPELSGVPLSAAAVFLPDPLPRAGRIAFWSPDASDPPDPSDGQGRPGWSGGSGLPGADDELTVVRSHGSSVRSRKVPALVLPVLDALPLLLRARRTRGAHPAAAAWGAAAAHALHLVARGRLLPGLTASTGSHAPTSSRTRWPTPRCATGRA